MMKQDKNVKCPYYHSEEPLRIHCEGVEQGCSITSYFYSKAGMASYKRRNCCYDWEHCRLAEAIGKQYE